MNVNSSVYFLRCVRENSTIHIETFDIHIGPNISVGIEQHYTKGRDIFVVDRSARAMHLYIYLRECFNIFG